MTKAAQICGSDVMITRIITLTDIDSATGRVISTISRTKTFERKIHTPKTILDYWLKNAPIPYCEVEKEMIRTGILTPIDKTWTLIHKGGSPQRHLRAFYNVFQQVNCLPFLSGPELLQMFNNSYNTQLEYCRGFNGIDKGLTQEAEIKERLSTLSVFRTNSSEMNHNKNNSREAIFVQHNKHL